MKCVWLIKATNDSNSKYEDKLSSAGYKTHTIPALSFIFINESSLKDSLNRPADHSGIILTSPRAVEAIARVYDEISAQQHILWKEKKIFAVGEATANLAQQQLGLECIGEDSGNSQQLSQFILKEIPAFDKPLLFPCGNLKKDDLPKILASNDRDFRALTCYETSANPDLLKHLKSAVVESSNPVIAVFFSPSGVEATVPLFGKAGIASSDLKFIALGPSTNAALVSAQLPVSGVCSSPTPDALLHALKGL